MSEKIKVYLTFEDHEELKTFGEFICQSAMYMENMGKLAFPKASEMEHNRLEEILLWASHELDDQEFDLFYSSKGKQYD